MARRHPVGPNQLVLWPRHVLTEMPRRGDQDQAVSRPSEVRQGRESARTVGKCSRR